MYPELTVNLNTIRQNVKTLVSLCGSYGIEITGISKVFCGEPEIVRAYLDGGIGKIGDARLENLMKIKDMPCEKWLIRTPQLSRAEDTVRYADVSLNSEISVLQALDAAACRLGKTHKVVLMYDLGDLREGFIDRESITRAAEFVRGCSGLELMGLGTNLTCFSFVHPDTHKLTELCDTAAALGAQTYISGGNSATLDLMLKGGIPKGVNLLRLGESLLFGRERAYYKYLENTANDAFILRGEIIECKHKPSMPWGHFGADSYGNTPAFTDRGTRKRIICALGKQDCDAETMWTVDEKAQIIGASSDHLILDVTDCDKDYRIGDAMEFRLGYYSTLRAFTSPYVNKIFLK